jgi:hypothetical protein
MAPPCSEEAGLRGGGAGEGERGTRARVRGPVEVYSTRADLAQIVGEVT